ncbi:MAG TPA: GNAT family protein [Bacteroidia bacterium]|jgi:RimJ/RimL family protein N-acetyltransferase
MNLKLRPWLETDLDALVEHINDPGIAKFMTDQFPYPCDAEKARSFIANANKHTPQRIFAIALNGEAAGAIGIHPKEDIDRKNAELGYWLGKEFWGKGIITAAIKQMVEYGFKNFDIARIYARPFHTNIASQKALEKAGFKLEARFEKTIFKDGEFLDELIYAVRK